jgi:MFS family permease
MSTLSDTFRAFENRQFRWIFTSNMTFFLAMQGQILVRAIMTYEITESAVDLGLVSFTLAIPMFCLSPFGGVIADRLDRRQLIIWGQAALICAELPIAMLYFTSNLELWHLLCNAVILGCIYPLIMPAQQALVVDVTGKQGLQNVMALMNGGRSASRILGPTLAGILVAVIGLGGAYTIGVMLYGVALLCLFGVSRRAILRDLHNVSALEDLVEGFRYVRDNRLVMVMIVFGILPMFLAMPFQSLLVVFTESVWDVGASGLGLLSAVSGIGALLGSLYVARFNSDGKQLRVMLISVLGFGFFLFLFAVSPWFLMAIPMVLIAGIFASVFGTVNQSATQMLIPDAMRGRISSFMMMTFSVTPMGTMPMSIVTENYGAPVAVSIASVAVIIIALVFYFASRTLRTLDSEVAKIVRDSR